MKFFDNAKEAQYKARTVVEAITAASKTCNLCGRYGIRSDCSRCPYETKEKVTAQWEDMHPEVAVAKTYKPKRAYKRKDGSNNKVTTLQSLYALLRRRYNSKEIAKRGIAKMHFLTIAHNNGVPEEIKNVQKAIEYAENNTRKWGRKNIAQYMCDEYNERW